MIISATSIKAQNQPTVTNIDSVYLALDNTIRHADSFLKKKQDTIRQLYEKYQYANNAAKRYKALSDLYDEYRYFNNDSALHYLHLCKKLAEENHDTEKKMVTLLRLAHQYVVTGYYPKHSYTFKRYAPDFFLNHFSQHIITTMRTCIVN